VFLVIYVSEAHAMDVWPIGNTVCIPNHKTIEERIEVAKKHLVEERNCKIPVLVDTMDDSFEKVYKGWPERYYIIQGDILREIGQPYFNGKGFSSTAVPRWLTGHFSVDEDSGAE